jgi:FkbM family methyltransferase
MSITKKMAYIVEKLTHAHILRVLPRGVDPFYDLSNCLPHLKMEVIFDIGANVGQSCRTYIERAPGSQIYCFEPVEQTFSILQNNFREHERVHKFKLAFGAIRGKGNMCVEGPSDLFFLEKFATESVAGATLEEVTIDTIDQFCRDININHINYLKVDTEGGDLDVLLGAKNMLQSHLIDIVDVEAGMNPKNQKHVKLEILKNFLEEKNYFIFGIYEQIHEWPSKEPHLRRVNAVFISSDIVANNKG